MDISQFKKEFMDEANKQLAVMNNSLKELNKESLTQFSNAAHILKSSSATMGYKQIANLSKAIEETLNEIINRKIEVTPAISDVSETQGVSEHAQKSSIFDILAECVSALAELIKAVDEGKKESDVSELINKLKSI